ncbi:hypothetical protein E2320_012491 [Naja naja]|nr:hypothetical protein E2320_012491 [Naja naja]
MTARYVPNKDVSGDPHLTLFVARLNLQTTEEKLKEVFSRYGDIRKIRLVRDLVTGFSKGYAFIEYKEERALLKAHRDANKLIVDQREIFVDFELERTLKGWIPRRLGGGGRRNRPAGFGGRDRPLGSHQLACHEERFSQRGQRERAWSREAQRDWKARERDWRSRERRSNGSGRGDTARVSESWNTASGKTKEAEPRKGGRERPEPRGQRRQG